MADSASPSTSTRTRSKHYFKVGNDTYSVSLNKTDYASISSVLGYKDAAGADDVINHITVGKAMQDGILFALKVSGTRNSRRASAKVYVPRPQIEEAFKSLLNKQYGTLKIARVAPVTHRVIIA